MIEFESYFNKWGIKLTETKVPKKMDNHKHRGALYFINEQQFLLVIPSVVRFLVSANEIRFERLKKCSDLDLFAFMSSTVLGAAFKLQGKLVFHGNTVQYKGNTFLICGPTGSAKSSIAAWLVKKGGTHICDEISVAEKNEHGQMCVRPGFPFIRLWEGVCNWLRLPKEQRAPLRNNIKKIRFNVPETNFEAKSVPLNNIIVSGISRPDDIEINQLKGLQKVYAMMNHLYRAEWDPCFDPKHKNMQDLILVAKHAKLSRLIIKEGFTKYKDIERKLLEEINA